MIETSQWIGILHRLELHLEAGRDLLASLKEVSASIDELKDFNEDLRVSVLGSALTNQLNRCKSFDEKLIFSVLRVSSFNSGKVGSLLSELRGILFVKSRFDRRVTNALYISKIQVYFGVVI